MASASFNLCVPAGTRWQEVLPLVLNFVWCVCVCIQLRVFTVCVYACVFILWNESLVVLVLNIIVFCCVLTGDVFFICWLSE